MLLIDKYAYTNKLAKVNPFYKFAIVIMALVLALTTSNISINITIFIVMFILTTLVAGIPLSKYLRILITPMSFLTISIIAILISISKNDIYFWSINIFNRYIGFTMESVQDSILLSTRVIASISSTFFLGLTTPLNDLIKVFKKIRIPDFVIELMVLIYRFIFVFLEEAREILLGQEIKFGYANFKNSLRSTSLLVRSLFLKVMLDYKDMEIILECKLYDGEFKTGD